MVVYPGPLNRVDHADPGRTSKKWIVSTLAGSLSLSIESVQSDRAGKSRSGSGCVTGVSLDVVVWLRIRQNQRQRLHIDFVLRKSVQLS